MSSADTSFLNSETQKFLAAMSSVEGMKFIKAQTSTNANPAICLFPVDDPNVAVESHKIASFRDGHPVKIDVYRSKEVPADAALPVLVFVPGGGWTIKATENHYSLARKLAFELKGVVILVHHSLSPRVKFPVALEECYSVIQYVTNPETASSLNVDPTRVAIGGDSSGGNLAITTTIFAKQRNELKNGIKYQVVYYPASGDSFDTDSYKKFANGYFLTRGLTDFFYGNYTDEALRKNSLVDPNLATTEELRGLPPALIVTCEADILRDGGEIYGRLLRKAGVSVTSIRVNGVIHTFMANNWILSEETYVTIDMTVSALRRAFSKK